MNAGRYDDASVWFSRAGVHGGATASLAGYVAACHMGRGDAGAAAAAFAQQTEADGADVTARIRHALALRAAGRRDDAVASLRASVAVMPECAELHFQLGTLLADAGAYEEAELRFTQARNIDRDHVEAHVSLAMCCGVRGAVGDAMGHLQRAQAARPHDARIGLLLAQAARAVAQGGGRASVRAAMPVDTTLDDPAGIEALSHVIESDPDFVDAFLSIPSGEVDERVFAMLLRTLELALEREPEHAELHYHCGRVLERLGRDREAIDANERAVGLDPTFIAALVELGRLYHRTDRDADATTRLEQAVAAGGEYADVYVLLGHLYRDQGRIGRARRAYRRALTLNDGYEEARHALMGLSA
ncbi:MAG: tetratricopeptide repeat protein [Phycisphaerae bacterium]